MLRSTLLAAAALALAAPAHAATIELRAGPVSLAAGQVARTLVSNAGTALCRASVTVSRGAVQEDGSVALTRQSSEAVSLPGGAGLVGYHDPNLMPELVQAQAVCECRSLTAAQARGVLYLTLETAAGRTGPALVAAQARLYYAPWRSADDGLHGGRAVVILGLGSPNRRCA